MKTPEQFYDELVEIVNQPDFNENGFAPQKTDGSKNPNHQFMQELRKEREKDNNILYIYVELKAFAHVLGNDIAHYKNLYDNNR